MLLPTAHATCTHVRENTSLLARPERRVLQWLARRVPPRITSDHLSALGLTATFAGGLFFAALAVSAWAAAGVVVSLALNWLGDSLDGTLARVRRCERPRYGYYVDHVIDLAGATFLLAGLACSTLMTPFVAVIVLAAYLLVSAETYLATHARSVFRISVLGMGPTELRIALAAGVLRAAYDPWVSMGNIGPVLLFDVGGAVAAAGMAGIFITSAVRNTRALHAAEPLAARHRAEAA